ncbi:GH32 C-terminal domain-containing protein [Catenibacterium mitsuokai]|nr:GH32 C-terminal domain-containing protein [Catenibacterium mitsuokai]
MTLFSDTSSLELFINDGAYAFTTRIYNNSDTIEIISNKEIDMTTYQLKAIDLEPAK